MTFSAAQYQENIGKSEAIPKRTRSYFQQRFQQQVFARLASAFAARAEEFSVTKSGIACLIDKDKAQVNRLLSHPTNLTLDTLSELALALNYEPTVFLEDLSVPANHNLCHPAYAGIESALDMRVEFLSAMPTAAKIRVSPKPDWELVAQ
jgi:hypothetical protein